MAAQLVGWLARSSVDVNRRYTTSCESPAESPVGDSAGLACLFAPQGAFFFESKKDIFKSRNSMGGDQEENENRNMADASASG